MKRILDQIEIHFQILLTLIIILNNFKALKRQTAPIGEE